MLPGGSSAPSHGSDVDGDALVLVEADTANLERLTGGMEARPKRLVPEPA